MTSSFTSNYNITRSTYSYYITVTLDIYEGKPGSITSCDVKYTNIVSDFNALIGKKTNTYSGGQNSKPYWYDSLFKGINAVTKQPVLKLGDITRKRIIISHKKRDNIRNIKKKLSRKFRNITHKRGL